jgi:hypothetical protein
MQLPNYLITLEKDQGLSTSGSNVFDGCFDSYGNICRTKKSFVLAVNRAGLLALKQAIHSDRISRISKKNARESFNVVKKTICESKVFE